MKTTVQEITQYIVQIANSNPYARIAPDGETAKEISECLKLFASQRSELTDEDVITYFNNHSSVLKETIIKIPVMTRSDVIEMFKWARNKLTEIKGK